MTDLRLITFSSAFQGTTEEAVRANHTELMAALEQHFTVKVEVVGDRPVFTIQDDEEEKNEKGEFANGIKSACSDKSAITLVFIASGGTEGMAVRHFAELPKPLRLLTDGKANSLAASMELACWVRQQGEECEIIHDDVYEIAERLNNEVTGESTSKDRDCGENESGERESKGSDNNGIGRTEETL